MPYVLMLEDYIAPTSLAGGIAGYVVPNCFSSYYPVSNGCMTVLRLGELIALCLRISWISLRDCISLRLHDQQHPIIAKISRGYYEIRDTFHIILSPLSS